MKLSFIIAAYNSSRYITRCIDSIYNLNLDESDFEVIVIDDCSKDNTVDVIKSYAGKHGNLILLQQPENHRQGAARNRGISIAKGEYVAFVDGDDATDNGVITALHTARRLDLDMVAMNCRIISGNGTEKDKAALQYAEDEIFTGIEMQTKQPYWGTSPWPYLYKVSFLKTVGYPFAENVIYEDSDFVSVHLYYAKRMAYCRESCYRYFINATSITKYITHVAAADYFLLGTRMLKFYSSLEDKASVYSTSIIDGGCYNIQAAFKMLYNFSSRKEIEAAFNRIDENFDRSSLLRCRETRRYWNCWTKLCLKHRRIAVLIASAGMCGRKLLKRR